MRTKAKNVWGAITGVVSDAFQDIKGFANGVLGAVNWVISKVNSIAHTSIGTLPLFGGTGKGDVGGAAMSGGRSGASAAPPGTEVMGPGPLAGEDGKGGDVGSVGSTIGGWLGSLWDKLGLGDRMPKTFGGLFGNASDAMYGIGKSAIIALLKKYGLGDRQKIVDIAMSYLGMPYVWGGKSPAAGGFDCSGLVSYAYHTGGHPEFPSVPSYGGTQISASQMQPADILLYYPNAIQRGVRVPFGHFKMYAGNGQTVESTSGGVQMQPFNSGYSQIRSYLALGGIATGPRSGYPVMLHGTEAVLPLNNPHRSRDIIDQAGYGGHNVTVGTGAVVINVTTSGDLEATERIVRSAVDDGLERLAREIAAA
jgi:cell wall-associated NlpC family hydrolase